MIDPNGICRRYAQRRRKYLGPPPVACCRSSPETSLAGRPDQQDAGLCELDIVVLELHFSPEGSAARQAEALAHPDNHVGGPRLALLPFHNLSLCKSQNASRRFFYECRHSQLAMSAIGGTAENIHS